MKSPLCEAAGIVVLLLFLVVGCVGEREIGAEFAVELIIGVLQGGGAHGADDLADAFGSEGDVFVRYVMHQVDIDYVVITTRGHLGDLDVLRHAVTKPCRYLGMIGSRRKVKTLFDQLREEGVADAVLDKVYSPIGLSIGAVTPAEIAVSIAAEMIRVRATRQ